MRSERLRAPLRDETSFSLRYSSGVTRKKTTRLRGSVVIGMVRSGYVCAYWEEGVRGKQFATIGSRWKQASRPTVRDALGNAASRSRRPISFRVQELFHRFGETRSDHQNHPHGHGRRHEIANRRYPTG